MFVLCGAFGEDADTADWTAWEVHSVGEPLFTESHPAAFTIIAFAFVRLSHFQFRFVSG